MIKNYHINCKSCNLFDVGHLIINFTGTKIVLKSQQRAATDKKYIDKQNKIKQINSNKKLKFIKQKV